MTELEIFRCDTDGLPVFAHPEILRVHAGHHLKAPVYLTPTEQEQVLSWWQELQP